MKFKTLSKDHHAAQCDSWADFLDWIKATPKMEHPHSDARSAHMQSWTGSDSFDHSMNLAEMGWGEGLELIRELDANPMTDDSVATVSPVMESSVVGDWYDMGDVIAGVPDCARYMAEDITAREGKIVDAYINLSVSAGVNTEEVKLRGAALMSLVDGLEARGFRVNVFASFSGKGYDMRHHEVQMPLKRSDEQMDRSVLAFAVIHPSTFRRLGFRALELMEDKFGGDMCKVGTYGRPHTTQYTDMPGIHIPHGLLNTRGASKQWIEETIKKYTEGKTNE